MKMQRLLFLILLFVSVSAWAQITVTPAANQTGWSCVSLTCATTSRQTLAFMAPQRFSITGTGSSLTYSRTGGPDLGFAINFCAVGTGITSVCSVVTTSPADMFLWNNGSVYTLAVGTQSETLTVSASSPTSSAAITVNNTVIAYTQPTVIAANGTVPAGGGACGAEASSVVFPDNPECVWSPNVIPGGNQPAGVPAAQGSSYIDPIFGTRITTIVPGATGVPNSGGYICGDAISGCINADHTLVQVNATVGATLTINSIATGLPVYTSFPGLPGSAVTVEWDPTDPTLLWLMDSNSGAKTIKKMVCSTPPSCTVSSYYTYSGAANIIGNSSDGRIRKDRWWGFITDGSNGDSHACMVDLPNLNTYCGDYSGLAGFTHRGDANVSDINVPNGHRYLYTGAFSPTSNAYWDLAPGTPPGMSALTLYGRGPLGSFNGTTNPGNFGWFSGGPCAGSALSAGICEYTQHSAMVTINGVVYWFDGGDASQFPFYNAPSLNRLDVGIDKSHIPVEEGGGKYEPMAVMSGLASGQSIHVSGAANVPVVSVDISGAQVCALRITNVTGTSPLHYATTDPVTGTPGFCALANGNTLIINGVQGVTNANFTHNSPCSVANLSIGSPSTWDCNGSSGSGTYTASTGVATLDVVPPFTKSRQSEILVYDLTNFPTSTVIHRFNLRSFLYVGYIVTSTGYYDQPHATLSNDGMEICWQAGYGTPDGTGVYCAPTGYVPGGPSVVSFGAGGGAVLR